MQAFIQYTPTEIIFGKGTQERTGEFLKKYKGQSVFLVYGGGSIKDTGLYDNILKQLEEESISVCTFGGVKPNPLLSHACEGIKKAIEHKADFILAVGGGSVIDTAKAIAIGAANPQIDIWKVWKREENFSTILPVGVVLTIAAAGSETSQSAVLTNSNTGEKRGFTNELMRPCFAIMNPELIYTLSKYQVGCGITDIMMHTLDRYFSKAEGNDLTDEIAAALMRTVIRYAEKLIENPSDYDAASEIMWCGSLSHNGLTGLGRPMDFSVHQLGHELGGQFDVAHGAALATMWASWARYCYKEDEARFAQYGRKVWNIDRDGDKSNEDVAKEAIQRTEEFFAKIGMPTCFSELGIGKQKDEILEEMATKCVFYGKRLIGNFKELDKEDIMKIYKMANH